MQLAAASASPADVVAEVSAVEGREPATAEIVRRSNGAAEPASVYAFLYSGDIVRVRGQAVVRLRLANRGVAEASPGHDFTAPPSQPGRFDRAIRLFDRIVALFARPPGQVVVHTLLRGDNAVARPAWLSQETQKLPLAMPHVGVAWAGAAATVTIRSALGSSTTGEPAMNASGMFDVPADLPFDVLAGGGGSGARLWRVVRTSPAAVPILAGTEDPSTPRERVLRAAWLMEEGPPEWRLFALTEIVAPKDDDIVAGRLWRLVRAGEWPGAR
ncbi:hypothetical protein [Novosphingobium sp.]|uniref:hypothetical protein n=1 Tax=Novosphingobium sp. TaxID=1874826 RepID=UPI00352A1150